MKQHVTIVAALRIGYSSLGILCGFLVWLILHSIGVVVYDRIAETILSLVGTIVGSVLVFLGIPGLVGGIGLLKFRPWARILVMIVSALDLFNVPIGTMLGVYSIIVLATEETAKLFVSGGE